MTTLPPTFDQLETAVVHLEHLPQITNPGDYEAIIQEREQCLTSIAAFRHAIDTLQQRVWRLPKLPPRSEILWAQAALTMPLAIVVLETTGINSDADILRVTVLNEGNIVLYDSFVRPTRYLTSNERFTGLTQNQVMNAPTFDVVYTELLDALKGRYMVAYGLEFMTHALTDNALHHQLPAFPYVIGADMQAHVQDYFRESWSLKLYKACEAIGYELGSSAPAEKRAEAQLRLLSAMSLGIIQASRAVDEDEHPF